MLHFKTCALSVSVFLISFTAYSQQSAEVLFQSGVIVKNYPRFPDRDPAFLARVSWNQKLYGNQGWHQNYRFPELTLQATAGSLGNKDEFGNIYSFAAGFRFTKTINEHLSLTAEACMGAASFSKPFNEFNNSENTAIGSRVTFNGTADGGIMYSLNRWSLLAKAGILHCSNSHIRLPNAGINLPMVSLGLRYNFTPKDEIIAKEKPAVDKKPKFNLRVSLGLNEQGGTAGPVNGPDYKIFLASAYIYRHYTPVARWQTGLEGYYNQGNYVYITSQRYYSESERLKSSSLLAILGHEYVFGHFGFVTQGGLYIYNPLALDRWRDFEDPEIRDLLRALFSARLGLQYYLFSTYERKHNNLFVGCYTKTNFGKADFMEFSLGYNF